MAYNNPPFRQDADLALNLSERRGAFEVLRFYSADPCPVVCDSFLGLYIRRVNNFAIVIHNAYLSQNRSVFWSYSNHLAIQREMLGHPWCRLARIDTSKNISSKLHDAGRNFNAFPSTGASLALNNYMSMLFRWGFSRRSLSFLSLWSDRQLLFSAN